MWWNPVTIQDIVLGSWVYKTTSGTATCPNHGGTYDVEFYACSYCGSVGKKAYCTNSKGPHYFIRTTYSSHECSNVTCQTCKGSGKINSTKTCTNCSSGKVNCSTCSGSGKANHSACSGSGRINSSTNCSHGLGYGNSHYYCSLHGNIVNQYHK